jgi:hypothetical protein
MRELARVRAAIANFFVTLNVDTGGSNCDLFRSHVTGSNDATLGEVG